MVHGSTIEYIHCIKNCYPYVFFLRIFFLRQLFDCYPRSPRRVRRVRLRVKQATAKVIPAGRCTHALGGALERLAAPPRQQALRACELAQIGFASPSGWLCQAGMSRGGQSVISSRLAVDFHYEEGRHYEINVPFCSNWTPGSRNLIRLGNGLLLSCPRPPPEGQASATKTRDVTSEDKNKNFRTPPTFVTFLVGAAHGPPPDPAPTPLLRPSDPRTEPWPPVGRSGRAIRATGRRRSCIFEPK